MRSLAFIKQNSKRVLLIVVMISLINVVTMYLLSEQYSDYFEYSFPKNALITFYNGFSDGDVTSVANYSMYKIEDTVSNVRGIDLAKIEFIPDNSDKMKNSIQENLNKRTKSIKQTIAYIYDSELLNENEINVPLKTLDFNHLIVGKYPENNQILVSEEFATELLSQSSNMSTYNSLIGTNYDAYTISGVYASNYNTLSDEIILYTDKNPAEKINYVSNYDKSTIDEIENAEYEYTTADDYKSLNYKLIFEYATMLLSFIIATMLLRREIKKFIYICSNNNINKLLIMMNVLSVYIIILIVNGIIAQVF